jgi:pentatricopeptide repeat protein
LKIKKKEFNFKVNVINCAQLIQALSHGGKMDDAMGVLDWMDECGIKPNATLFLCLLKPCKDLATGKRIHDHIISSQTELDVKLSTSLLSMYIKCKSMDDACSVFHTMQLRDVISWNAMISGYTEWKWK